MATRAVALLSGGLDSMLAIRVLQEQGIEVEGLDFDTLFLQDADRQHAIQTAGKQNNGTGRLSHCRVDEDCDYSEIPSAVIQLEMCSVNRLSRRGRCRRPTR